MIGIIGAMEEEVAALKEADMDSRTDSSCLHVRVGPRIHIEPAKQGLHSHKQS